MEHFTISHWRAALRAMARRGALTAGVELWPHPARIARRRTGFGPVWHYSGNFWWARPSFLARLPDPLAASRDGRDRHECSEDWLHTNWNRWQAHEELHTTAVGAGLPGRIHKYKDRCESPPGPRATPRAPLRHCTFNSCAAPHRALADPEDMYTCADRDDPSRPSRTPCKPITRCHGSIGCPNAQPRRARGGGSTFF